MPPAVMTSNPSESPMKVSPVGKDWSSTFPDTFDTKTESDLFMTRCLYVAFSHILESRRLIPTDVFKKRTIEGIVKTYVMNLKHPLGLRIANKFRGAGEAIKCGYLDSFVLVISSNEENPNDAIEVYTWKMKYNDDGTCSASLSGRDEEAFANVCYTGPDSVKKQTKSLLLRVRHICRNLLAAIPSGACPSFRITYTSKAPKGYQAEGFKPFPTKDIYNLDERAKDVNICGVATSQMKMLLSVKSIFIDDEYTLCCRLDEMSESEAGDISLLNQTVNNNSLNDSIEQARLDGGINTSSDSVSSTRIRRTTKRLINKEEEPVVAKKSANQEENTKPTRRAPGRKHVREEIENEFETTLPGYASNVTQLSPEASPKK